MKRAVTRDPAGTSDTFRRDAAGRAEPHHGAGFRTPRAWLLLLLLLQGMLAACTASGPPPRPPAPPAPRIPATQLLAAVRAAPAIRSLPADLTPSLATVGRDVGFDSNRCEAAPAADRIAGCVLGDPAGSTKVVLYGDSHAGMWLPALTEIARRRHWQVRFFGKPSCPAPALTFWNEQAGRGFGACDRFRAYAEGQVLAERPDLVLVTSESYGQRTGRDRTVTADEWQAGLVRTLTALRRSGARIVLIGDTPVPAQSPPECLARHAPNLAACFTTRAAATRQVLSGADQAAARATGSGYLPVLPWLCGAVCTPVIGHVLVYRDRFHLSATYSRMLTGVLESALLKEFPQEFAP